jgi:hypothetical protein
MDEGDSRNGNLKRHSAEGSFPGDTKKYVKEIYPERCKNAL